jgi:hypothetical protein
VTNHSRHVKHLTAKPLLQLQHRPGGWSVVDGNTGRRLLPFVSSLSAVRSWMSLRATRDGAVIDHDQVERELDRAADRAVRWARQPKPPANVIPFPLERRK